MSTAPPTPSFTVARFAIAPPALATLRLDVVGRKLPAGNAVTKPGADAPMLAMLSTAALASAGTPARPATWTRIRSGASRVKPTAPSSGRVSASRVGPSGRNADAGPSVV